ASTALAAYVYVNGHKAHCLFDTGCESVMISQEFADACKVPIYEYENPSLLQLAVKGSRSSINYGADVKIAAG
ncbi:hypothetical protein SISNIDRAFT_388869, partial [Sistotremastrum niveocremeum HHB9708]